MLHLLVTGWVVSVIAFAVLLAVIVVIQTVSMAISEVVAWSRAHTPTPSRSRLLALRQPN